MDSAAFVTELEQGLEQVLRRLTPEDALQAELDGDLTVENLLKVALRNELEATEIAARWMATTPEVEVKLAFARQIGDEAKHYRPPAAGEGPGSGEPDAGAGTGGAKPVRPSGDAPRARLLA